MSMNCQPYFLRNTCMVIIFGVMTLCACQANERRVGGVMNPASVDSGRAVAMDTVGGHRPSRADTAAVESPFDIGSVAYYCPAKMIIYQPSFITVTIAKEDLKALINSVDSISKQIAPGAKAQDVKGDTIEVTKKMKVALVFSSDNFKFIDTPSMPIQSFGNNKELTWEWSVQPLKIDDHVLVGIHVFGYDNTGDAQWVEVVHPVKTFYVKVTVDGRTFWDKTLTFFEQNPKFIWASIIIPIVTFFGGILFGKRRKKESAT
jgi:hypothetical protein